MTLFNAIYINIHMSDQEEKFEFNERRKVDARIVRLEQITENLTDSIGKLTADVTKLADMMRANNRTNWGVIATWVSVGILLVIALSNGYVGKPLDQLTMTTKEIRAELKDHEITGHPGITNRINSNSEAIIAVDRNIRNIIEIKDAALQRQIDELRSRIDSNIKK